MNVPETLTRFSVFPGPCPRKPRLWCEGQNRRQAEGHRDSCAEVAWDWTRPVFLHSLVCVKCWKRMLIWSTWPTLLLSSHHWYPPLWVPANAPLTLSPPLSFLLLVSTHPLVDSSFPSLLQYLLFDFFFWVKRLKKQRLALHNRDRTAVHPGKTVPREHLLYAKAVVCTSRGLVFFSQRWPGNLDKVSNFMRCQLHMNLGCPTSQPKQFPVPARRGLPPPWDLKAPWTSPGTQHATPSPPEASSQG